MINFIAGALASIALCLFLLALGINVSLFLVAIAIALLSAVLVKIFKDGNDVTPKDL